jgi:hypothetical protein
MTDTPFLFGGTVPGVDPETGKIWPQFLPEGNAGGGATYMAVLVYSNGTYPPRPSAAPSGFVRYIGPVQPTSWLANDEWVNNA